MQSTIFEQLSHELNPEHWPRFGETNFTENSATFKLIISPDLDYFDGHFPEQAVLPGVVQIHWAAELARQLFACTGFSELIKVKFNGVVLPNACVTLSLTFREDVKRVDFNYADEQQKLSSGVMSFQAQA